MPTLNWIEKEAVAKHQHQVLFHLLKDVPALVCGQSIGGTLLADGDTLVAFKALPKARQKTVGQQGEL
jgi:hypothetical protein